MKLFSRQRRQLLRKYIPYALGEIILVVIGILIAVSINNANESRKADQKRLQLAQNVYNQMVIDSLDLNVVLREQDRANVLYDKILRETAPGEPIVDCKGCAGLIIANFSVVNLDTKVRALLEDAELVEDSISVLLRQVSSDYNDAEVILGLLESSVLDNLKDNVQFLRDTYPWFSQFIANGKCDNGCQEYFTLSEDYRNRVAYQEMLTRRAHSSELQTFLNTLREHLIVLDKYIATESE